MIKIITGWSHIGGSTTAFVNLTNLFNKNNIDCILYGPHIYHLDKCKADLIQNLKLDINDNLIIHFYDPQWDKRPPIKGKLIYSCHEKDIRPINSFNYKIFDKIHYVSKPQQEWHKVDHPYFTLPNIVEELTKFEGKKEDKIAGIIGSIDENKQVHVSIERALKDKIDKIFIWGKITDVKYYNEKVQPLVNSNKNVYFLGFSDNKQKIYDTVTDVYLSSKSETWSYIKKECDMTGVNFHGTDAVKNNFKNELTNDEILRRLEEGIRNMLIIGVTCYNAERFIGKTIQSIKLQKEQNWHCYITNDLSTDDSVEVAKLNIADDKRFTIINNKEKHWQTGNYWQICHHKDVNEDDIFVELDGDDYFADADVLTRVNKYYEDPNVWMSFGSFEYSDGRPGFAKPPTGGIHQQRVTNAFTTSHLRTWRIKLFRHLKRKDVCEDDRKTFIPVSGDLYFFQCMLELCGEEHSKFITDINYVYNDNDLSEHIVDINKVFHYTNKAKTRKPKKQLESL